MLRKAAAKKLLRLALPVYYPVDDQTARTLSLEKMNAYMTRFVNVLHLGVLMSNNERGELWRSNIWGSKFNKKESK